MAIGGYAAFSWAVAGFLIGSVIAGNMEVGGDYRLGRGKFHVAYYRSNSGRGGFAGQAGPVVARLFTDGDTPTSPPVAIQKWSVASFVE